MLSVYMTLWAAALILSVAGCLLPAILAMIAMVGLVAVKHRTQPTKTARG